MGDPHNKARYGELWDPQRVQVCLAEMEHFCGLVTFSGGLAWHWMSPVGHAELKHAHDHKDADCFVRPAQVAEAIGKFEERGFTRTWTRFDRHPSPDEFRRYEKVVSGRHDVKPVKVTVDFFVREVPSIEAQGHRVVEPKYLLSLYGSIHSSDKCFAVQAATKLIAKGISPVGRSELVEIPR